MKSLSFLLVMLVACGGKPESVNQPITANGPGSAAAKPVTSSDVAFELAVIDIKGSVFEPEALGRPGMPLVDPKKTIPLDKQRALVQTTKDPVQKQAQAAVLATMLYRESKNNKAKEKELLTDARQVLRDVAQQVGDKAIDEITLRLLGSYELLLDDYPAAERAWQALIEKDPKSKDAPDSRAWLAYAQLKQFKNADALATVGADKPDDKQPELAYVTGWAKLRGNDGAGAWQAITTAARGWGQNPGRDELEREILYFVGRTTTSFDQAVVPAFAALVKADVGQAGVGKAKPEDQAAKVRAMMQYELLAKLGLSAYASAGRWNDAIVALNKALEIAGNAVPVQNLPLIRYSQAEFAVRLDTPDVAARYGKQAIEAFGPCAAKCSDKDKSDTVLKVYLIGRLFHTLYATANDRRYYQPAHDLYEVTIPLLGDAATRTQAQKDAKVLEVTLKNIKVGTGTHDKGAVGALLVWHNAEIDACYEAGLAMNPKLGGTITLTLESDATGATKGLMTEPKPGQTELSAVAGCVIERAKQWRLPRRGMPGSTRIKMSYAFSVKK